MLADFFEQLRVTAEEESAAEYGVEARPFVKDWKLSDLKSVRELNWNDILARKSNLQRGEELFKSASCSRCHQVDGHGGRVGPNLSGAARRFSPRDFVEAVIEPSKTIPHDFQAVTILKTNGQTVYRQDREFQQEGNVSSH